MNSIKFVRCYFEADDTELTVEQLKRVVFEHYCNVLKHAPRDENGDATVEGRYILITGTDGDYTVQEVEPQ